VLHPASLRCSWQQQQFGSIFSFWLSGVIFVQDGKTSAPIFGEEETFTRTPSPTCNTPAFLLLWWPEGETSMSLAIVFQWTLHVSTAAALVLLASFRWVLQQKRSTSRQNRHFQTRHQKLRCKTLDFGLLGTVVFVSLIHATAHE